jgi:hypothetical protein
MKQFSLKDFILAYEQCFICEALRTKIEIIVKNNGIYIINPTFTEINLEFTHSLKYNEIKNVRINLNTSKISINKNDEDFLKSSFSTRILCTKCDTSFRTNEFICKNGYLTPLSLKEETLYLQKLNCSLKTNYKSQKTIYVTKSEVQQIMFLSSQTNTKQEILQKIKIIQTFQ